MEAELTTKNVLNILTCDYSNTDRQTLFELEREKKIPLAQRKKSGKIEKRFWSINDLPKIAQFFGYLDKPKSQKVISVYAPKGGVLKTTFTFNMARALALHGIKTIVVGLDSQISVTSLCEQTTEIEDLNDYSPTLEPSLYNFFETGTSLESLIKKTDLEYLDYISETDDLDRLSMSLNTKRKPELQLKESLLPRLKNYDVVLFDNPPAFSMLSVNSIVAADVLITPLGCEIEAFKAVDRTLEKLFRGLIKDYALDFKQIYVPTKLDNTSLSKQIQFAYQNKFKGDIVLSALRTSVSGQEASYEKKSIFEHKADSPLAQDYYQVIKEVWQKVLA